jgi:hypothetical protein
MLKTKKFIHFGCWNQGFCNKSDSANKEPLTKVMRQLNQTLQSQLGTDRKNAVYEFIVLAGDNYYPQKEKKDKGKDKGDKDKGDKGEKSDKVKDKKEKSEKKIKEKIVRVENLRSGFECLPHNIDIHVILGNHDLETTITGEKQLRIDAGHGASLRNEPAGECSIINMEKEIIADLQSSALAGKEVSFDLFKCRLFGKNTLVIMLDTSMYDVEDAESFLPCYNVKLGTNYTDINEVRELQKTGIVAKIAAYTKKGTARQSIANAGSITSTGIANVVIIGHHPITGYKHKNAKTNIIPSPPLFINLLYDISREFTLAGAGADPNYYYLCADLHLYQCGKVTITPTDPTMNTMHIQQHIVGTGGTELDDSPFDTPDKLDAFNQKFASGSRANAIVNNTSSIPGDPYTVVYHMTQNQLDLAQIQKYGFLVCELQRDKNLSFTFVEAREGGIQYSEQGLVGQQYLTRRNTSTRKTKQRSRKSVTFKKGSF